MNPSQTTLLACRTTSNLQETQDLGNHSQDMNLLDLQQRHFMRPRPTMAATTRPANSSRGAPLERQHLIAIIDEALDILDDDFFGEPGLSLPRAIAHGRPSN